MVDAHAFQLSARSSLTLTIRGQLARNRSFPMYSVILLATMTTMPAEPAGIFRNRGAGCAGATAQSAGCQGQQAASYQLIRVQAPRASGCSGGFGAGAGCQGDAGRGGLFPGHQSRVERRQERRAEAHAPRSTTLLVPAPQQFVAAPQRAVAPAVVADESVCPHCQGKGTHTVTFEARCPVCNGTGKAKAAVVTP
jgi:hypothetical protein